MRRARPFIARPFIARPFIARPALAAAVLAAWPARPARAADPAPTPAAQAVAEALFRDGRTLMEQGDLTEGCHKLEESWRLDPTLGTSLNVALCHELQGRTASAWAEFNAAIAAAVAANQKGRAELARAHAAAVEKRLSKLILRATDNGESLIIQLNEQALGAAALGSAIPVDPGALSITVTSPGKKPWSRTVQIEPGPSSLEVVIPALEPDLPAAAPASAPTPPRPSPVAPARPPVAAPATTAPAGWRPLRIAGAAVFGLGVVSMGVGGYLGIRTVQATGDIDARCPRKACDDRGLALRDDARQTATAADIGLAAGGACVVAGAVLFLLGRPERPVDAKKTSLSPLLSPGRIGVAMRGAF